jgi:hypothetical protein
MGEKMHLALQFLALPLRRSAVQAAPSLQEVGQLEGGSQLSPLSSKPFPQLAEQSPSVLLPQAGGQQPSPVLQAMMTVCLQLAVQAAAVPLSASWVQASPSLQDVGQLEGGSQLSPLSMTPLPHQGTEGLTPGQLVSSASAVVLIDDRSPMGKYTVHSKPPPGFTFHTWPLS